MKCNLCPNPAAIDKCAPDDKALCWCCYRRRRGWSEERIKDFVKYMAEVVYTEGIVKWQTE